MSSATPTPDTPTGHPSGFWFFFWGEFAERCSYYGMRAILPLYLTTRLNMSDERASEWYYAFKMACYFLPLLGGFLADRYLGKYWTIVGFSVPYVLGQLLIGVEDDTAVMCALALCAMGSGVIKPNISALLGLTYDQQRPGAQQLRASAFLWFYFAVNVGSLISLLGLPIIRNMFGYQVAFLVPAAFMTLALLVFAAGKKRYAVEVVGSAAPMTPEERGEQWRTLTRLFGVFGLMVFFWVVYEHNDVQWVFFARDHIDLKLPDWLGGQTLAPDQFQFINALCVLVLIAFFQWFWKRVDPTGTRFPSTTKVLIGFLFTGAGPALMAAAAFGATGGAKVSMLWIVAAYVLLTVGEVLVYGTMLDLSYAHAPARMKGLVTACFLVTNTLGNFVNTQLGKLYFSGPGKGEEVVESLNWGARVTTVNGDTVFRFYPEAFFTIDVAIALAAAAGFFVVARRFNRSTAPAQ
ncbi:amino acid peptide transporter : Amino acid/peptide transporter OS=Nitrospirillum amazonense Y2 GN=AZA_58783 PE=3 SV=1: PTR2: PTR2 [Gemmata massiliana]|uniref:Major facilitator superfamily (MFS) profile domain-containing protein n=1 Tax=Gemmata massiliana TaxID=1210884 RepID=A0A6P2D1Y0_9BACT|nr:MFS transporter [Gemmata massiliana]VTR95129.1 amino acid peptide transporter : Amino acid/peptide transporter OS=Nitrospirillum amazonense Y2 GN=AZA_58783 PE=3 SV=1: PTR2: PTR2 [Gemmata massiliana]